MKKAHEIGVLCDQDAFLFVRDRATHKIRMFSSSDEQFVPQYGAIKDEDRKGPSDMQVHYEKTKTRVISTMPTPLPSNDKLKHKKNVYKDLLQQSIACQNILRAISLLWQHDGAPRSIVFFLHCCLTLSTRGGRCSILSFSNGQVKTRSKKIPYEWGSRGCDRQHWNCLSHREPNSVDWTLLMATDKRQNSNLDDIWMNQSWYTVCLPS